MKTKPRKNQFTENIINLAYGAITVYASFRLVQAILSSV